MNTLQTISPSRAAELVRKGAVLIDIHAEYAREHIPGSRHHALSRIDNDTPVREGDDAQTKSNAQKLAGAAQACETYILEGGIAAWKKAGLPVKLDHSQPIDVLRQVQISAGAKSQAAQAFHRDDGQQSQLSDLPQSCAELDVEWSQPTLGSRHHLCHNRERLCVPGCILDAWSRRVVGYAISRSIDARSLLLHSRPPSMPAIRQGAVCIIPTVGRSMPPKTIAPSCKSTVSPAPWAGAAIPTTTPRPKAS